MSRKRELSLRWLPRLELLLRWILGLAFIYAGAIKISDPAAFAKIIYGYKLFPGFIINVSAIVLPFIEVFAGVLLVTGMYIRSAAVIINFFLLIFITAISINLLRGHTFDCGCFSTAASDSPASAVSLLVRDILMLFAASFVFLFRGRRIWCCKADNRRGDVSLR